ncbi:MAG: PAS domain-containing protein [bacterium]|nr:PAS domain-containing protein [bacterium]
MTNNEDNTTYDSKLANLPVAMLFIDDQFRLLHGNTAAGELCNYPLERIIGLPLLELIHPDYRMATAIALKRIRDNKKLQLTFRLHYNKNMEVTAFIGEAGANQYALVLIPFSERSGPAFESEMQQRLILARQRRSEIARTAAMFAHSLNTPLGVASGRLQMLRLQHPEIGVLEEVVEQVDRIRHSLDALKLKTQSDGDQTPRRFSVNELLKTEFEFVQKYHPIFAEVAIHYEFSEKSVELFGLRSDLTQALIQLAGFVLEFSGESVAKHLTIVTLPMNDTIVISITNTSPNPLEQPSGGITFYNSIASIVQSHPITIAHRLMLQIADDFIRTFGGKIELVKVLDELTVRVFIPQRQG